MNLDYDLLVRHEVYLALKQTTKSDQNRVLSFIESLSADPFQKGDSHLNDEKGRQYEARFIGKHALIYWADHSEKELRIVNLLDADQL